MDLRTFSGEDMRAAQLITGATLAMYLMASVVPGLRPYVARIRVAIVGGYFIAVAGFMIHLLAR